jgi:Holliday junction resolvase
VRRAAKRDASENRIVTALRLLGWSIQHLNLAHGPDLLAGRGKATHLIECKTGTGKLRVGQQRWHEDWRGAEVVVLRSVADALKFHQMTVKGANG